MTKRPDFYHWIDMCATQKRIAKHLRKEGPLETYSRLAEYFRMQNDYNSVNACMNELDWYRYGKPYYKVWPQMSAHLSNVNIDIDCKYIHLPFPVYEIRLPKDSNFREDNNSPNLQAIFVAQEKHGSEIKTESERDWSLSISYQFETDLANNYMGWFFRMPMKEGTKVEHQINTTLKKNERADDTYSPSNDMCKAIVRMAVSVALFGINQHELIMPDLPRKMETRYHVAQKDKNESEAKKMLDKAKRLGHFGWRIGSEIDLPTPIVKHETIENGIPSRHLEFGHIRRGHMRLQPYGKENEDKRYELIFIAPTMIRPDLPIQDMRGFRIKD